MGQERMPRQIHQAEEDQENQEDGSRASNQDKVRDAQGDKKQKRKSKGNRQGMRWLPKDGSHKKCTSCYKKAQRQKRRGRSKLSQDKVVKKSAEGVVREKAKKNKEG